ncbi:MAG: response regulator [Flavobacteriales bacterium]|nr:response regulator [Flavobacteriales bacterium]
MKKVLLVEDDEDKRNQIIHYLNGNFICELEEVRSYHSALNAVRTQDFDLILLDMTIPTFDITSMEPGGRSQPFGGELILSEMDRKSIDSKVVIITQFDLFGEGDEEIGLSDLNRRLINQFSDIYIGAIQYSISYNSWQELLRDKIKNIVEIK